MRRLIERKKQQSERKLCLMHGMIDGLDVLLAKVVDEAQPVSCCPIFAALEAGKILP